MHTTNDQIAQGALILSRALSGSLAAPTAETRETSAPLFENFAPASCHSGASQMTIKTNTPPGKGASDRMTAEAAINGGFSTVIDTAMASARAYQRAWTERKA